MQGGKLLDNSMQNNSIWIRTLIQVETTGLQESSFEEEKNHNKAVMSLTKGEEGVDLRQPKAMANTE